MRPDGKISLPAVLVSLFVAGTACSIKESRQLCPCWATVNLAHFEELMDYEYARTEIITGSRLIEDETVAFSDYAARPYEKKLEHRAPTTIAAACGYEAMSSHSDSLICKLGSEVGRVWTASLTQDCNGDYAWFDLHPHKDYTTITFIVLGIDSADEFMYDMRVRANYNGVRLRDRKPVEGPYVAYVRPREAGVIFDVRVPRQADDEMVLDMLAPRPDRTYTVDDRIDVIPLGLRLRSQGFDWGKEDLDDAVVTIDFASLSTNVIVREWKKEEIEETI